MNNSLNITEKNIEEIIVNTLTKVFSAKNNEWMTIAEGSKYAGVSHNTFMKFREKGLKVCQVDGVKRVSRKEIDNFMEKYCD